MKKILVLCGALMVMTAVAANAQLNLASGDCLGPQNANWVCTSNSTGNAFVAVASVLAPALTTLTGEEGMAEIAFAVPVPAWWKTVGTGACRLAGANKVGFVAPGAGGCAVDYFGNVGAGPSGGGFYTIGPGSDPEGSVDENRIRVRTVSAVDYNAALLTPPPAVGDEVFLFTVTVNRTLSTGTGSCAGCATPACMVFKKLKLTQPVGVGDFLFQAPLSYGYMTLQGGAGTDCPSATPASRSSWGQVKSLYR